MSAFGDELKRLAEVEGLTQKQIAEASGVAQSFIGKLMRGEQVAPRADALYRLCDALGVECDHFRPFLTPADSGPDTTPPAEVEPPTGGKKKPDGGGGKAKGGTGGKRK